MPKITAGARIACTSTVAAFAVVAGLLVPVQAHAADTGVLPGRYENTSTAISYVGAWATNSSASDSGGSYGNLNVDGSASLTFTGTGVTWFTRLTNYSGIADVYLDGVKKATVDLYSATSKTKQSVYAASALTDGTHTLKIVRTGAKNDSSTGRNVTLDYLDVVDANAPSVPDAVKVAKEGAGARLTWAASPEADVNGYHVYRATGSGSYTKISAAAVTGADYLDDALTPGTTYAYQLTAVDRAGNESARSATVTLTLDTPALTTVDTPTPTPTPVATPTPTAVVTPTPAPAETSSPVVTPTPTPSDTSAPPVTPTPTPVVTPTSTPTPSVTPTPTNVVGQGTYENDDPAVTLNGTWSKASSVSDSGGSSSTLSTAGYAELSFSTSGIRWITRLNSFSGIADVYLDGVKTTTVDLYSATTKTKQVAYEVTGLPETPHTIRIVRTGTKNPSSSSPNIMLDAFVAPDVHAPGAPTGLGMTLDGPKLTLGWTANPEPDVAGYNVFRSVGTGPSTKINTGLVTLNGFVDDGLAPGTSYAYQVSAVDTAGLESPRSATTSLTTEINPVGQGTYENDDPAVTLNGAWSKASSVSDSGGSSSTLSTAGYAELSFNTSGIRWITRLNNYSGIADVYLDGVKKTTVDLYSSTSKTKQVAYEVTGLPETPHTIRIVRTGNKNPSSYSPSIMVDAFVAPDIHEPLAPAGLTATITGADVQLAWSPNGEPDLKAYRVYRQEGSSTTRTLIGTTTADVRTLTDAARIPGVTYTYDLVAVDTSDNVSGYSPTASVTMPITPQPAGVYENDDAAVTLNGAWAQVSSPMDSAGSYASLNTAGYAEISFKTSGIRWITRFNNYSGIADVYLDGVKTTSVDLYSSTTKYQQVAYEVTGLPETTHTLRVVKTTAKNPGSTGTTMILDSFVAPDLYPPSAPTLPVAAPGRGSAQLGWNPSPESDVVGYRVYRTALTGSSSTTSSSSSAAAATAVNSAPVPTVTYVDEGLQPGAAYRYQIAAVDAMGNESPRSEPTDVTLTMKALPAGTYEDDDADAILLKGPWGKLSSTGAGTDSGGSYTTLNADGYAEMSFATSGIRWLARTNNTSGQADVYIDGEKKATVDLYSATTKYAQNVYEITGLSETGHTIRIVRTGNKNASSTGRNVILDALVAPDIYAPTAPTAATTTAIRTGATVSWAPSPEADVASYRVFRRTADTADVLVGTAPAGTTSFADVGLAGATAFTYTVVARDTWDNDSPASAAATFTTPAEALGGNLRYASCPTGATKTATNRTTLVSALATAKSGDVIRMAPGTYPGLYEITTVADPSRPLWICGPRSAVFDFGDHTTGANIKFSGAANVVLAGMTVRNAQKGISVNTSNHITIADTRVENIGEEAIHLKNQTTDSTVVGNSIANTGLLTPKYGEGVYIGTSDSNWCAYNNCQPDASDRNSVIGNDISNTTAESIDAKNGTEDGTIANNTLDGTGMVADLSDSLVSVMGNGWVVAGNTMTNAPQDGIQIWEPTGYGKNNVAYANMAAAGIPGYNTRLPFNDTLGNVVGCDSPSTGAALGLSNKVCQN